MSKSQTKPQVEEKFLDSFGGTKIYYKIFNGKGTPLLILHGMTGSGSAYQTITDFAVENGRSIILPDLRGHGLSAEGKKNDYSLLSFAKDIDLILEKEAIKEVILFGHCFGGIVGQEFIREFGEKIRGIILVNTNYKTKKKTKYFFLKLSLPLLSLMTKIFFPSYQKKKYEQNDYSKYKKITDWYIPRITKDWDITSFPIIFKILKQIFSIDYTLTLEKIKVPTLVIAGKKDTIFNYKISKEISTLVPGSELMLFDKGNHVLPIDKSYKIEKIIFDFLDKYSL